MELNVNEMMEMLAGKLEHLAAALGALEGAATRLERAGEAQSGEVGKITAAIESEGSRRERELEERLREAEQEVAALRAAAVPVATAAPASVAASTRKTLPTATVQLLAKQGIEAGESVDVRQLDAALVGMPVEQRIAVKSQMIRAGGLVL